jgi:hypothetical protein
MNIFVLSEDPFLAASQVCDKHVVKMPLETAQMLSTIHRVLDGHETIRLSKNGRRIKTWVHPTLEHMLYRSTMVNHPCTIWGRENVANYWWLVDHGIALCNEYTRRYGRTHASQTIIDWCQQNAPQGILDAIRTTPFAQAMPDYCKVPNDAVSAYRQYYLKEKEAIASWKHSEVPNWYLEKNWEHSLQVG